MKDFDWRTLELEERDTKTCDQYGCDQEGAFPAPKNIHQPSDRYYFCLDHVKAYNSQWDYLDQVRSSPDDAPKDDEPHHPFKRHGKPFSKFFTRAPHDPLGILGEDEVAADFAAPTQKFFSPKTPEGKAFVALKLSWPFTEADLKQSYKALAKKHHPDLNQGDPKSIDRFREIKEAYELLTDLLLATFGSSKGSL